MGGTRTTGRESSGVQARVDITDGHMSWRLPAEDSHTRPLTLVRTGVVSVVSRSSNDDVYRLVISTRTLNSVELIISVFSCSFCTRNRCTF